MTDHARRALTEEERARMLEARYSGGLCAGCGRALADDELVWRAPFALPGAYGSISHQWGPAGRECAAPEVLRETEGREPVPCTGRGRGVYYRSGDALRRVPTCSKRCAGRYQTARARARRRGE